MDKAIEVLLVSLGLGIAVAMLFGALWPLWIALAAIKYIFS